jgi:hypothetical protein
LPVATGLFRTEVIDAFLELDFRGLLLVQNFFNLHLLGHCHRIIIFALVNILGNSKIILIEMFKEVQWLFVKLRLFTN